MDILETIMSAGEGAAVRQLGQQFGLGDEQTASALSALVPALAAGFKNNVQTTGGLAGLIAALAAGNHDTYITDPTSLSSPAAIDDGNGILGHVLGNKDASRAVARRVAGQTGISAGVLQQMLPLAATLMMGAFSRQLATGGRLSSDGTGAAGGLVEMLSPLLTQSAGSGGSPAAGLAGLFDRFFGR